MTIWAAKLSKHVRATSIPLPVEPKVLISIIDPPRWPFLRKDVRVVQSRTFILRVVSNPGSVSKGIKKAFTRANPRTQVPSRRIAQDFPLRLFLGQVEIFQTPDTTDRAFLERNKSQT